MSSVFWGGQVEVAFPRELAGGNKMLRAAWWKKVRHVDIGMRSSD